MKKLWLLAVVFLAGCTTQPQEVDIEKEVQAYLDAHMDELKTEISVPTMDAMSMSDVMVNLIEDVDKAVLLVGNMNNDEQFNSTGTTVLYKYEDGYYYGITNNHVVDGSAELRVYHENKTFDVAELVGTDPESDIAVIKFQSDEELKIVPLGNEEDLMRGQIVIAIGSPGGFDYYNSATWGIISGLERYIGIEDTDNDGIDDVFVKMLQHDAAINPGNSGGPLFNLNGEVVGINTIKLVKDEIEGMGFSIPMDIVKRVIEDIETFGEVKHTRMGIYVGDVQFVEDKPEGVEFGAYISDITPGGPVDLTSDLQIGDVIVEFGGVEIDGLFRLKGVLFMYRPGDEVELKFFRDGEILTTSVVLGEK